MIGNALAILLTIAVGAVGLLCFGLIIHSPIRPRPFRPSVIMAAAGSILLFIAYLVYLFR